MNPQIANEVYNMYYSKYMQRPIFDKYLEEGLTIIDNSDNNIEQTEACKIAMLYNEQAMLQLLMMD